MHAKKFKDLKDGHIYKPAEWKFLKEDMVDN